MSFYVGKHFSPVTCRTRFASEEALPPLPCTCTTVFPPEQENSGNDPDRFSDGQRDATSGDTIERSEESESDLNLNEPQPKAVTVDSPDPHCRRMCSDLIHTRVTRAFSKFTGAATCASSGSNDQPEYTVTSGRDFEPDLEQLEVPQAFGDASERLVSSTEMEAAPLSSKPRTSTCENTSPPSQSQQGLRQILQWSTGQYEEVKVSVTHRIVIMMMY